MAETLPYKEDVQKWTVEQLSAWLQQMKLCDISDIYLREGIDGYSLSNLAEGEHIALLNTIPLRRRLHFLNLLKKIEEKPTIHCSSTFRSDILRNHSSDISKKREAFRNELAPVKSLGCNGDTASTCATVKHSDEGINEGYLVPLVNNGPKKPILSRKRDAPVPPGKGRCPSPASKCKESKCKDDINAYEVIEESPKEVGGNFFRKGQQSSRPPDLPDRNNVISSLVSSSSPVIPVRIQSSPKYQQEAKTSTICPSGKSSHIHSTRPLSSPPAPPSSKLSRTAKQAISKSLNNQTIVDLSLVNSQSATNSKSFIKIPSSITNRYCERDLSSSGVTISSKLCHSESGDHSSSSGTFLNLDGGKVVPFHPIYKQLISCDYFRPISRSALQDTLIQEGMFVIRPSTHSEHLLTLSVKGKSKVFNIVIRSRSDGTYALGNEKPGEMGFDTIQEIVDFHAREPIKAENGALVYLRISPK